MENFLAENHENGFDVSILDKLKGMLQVKCTSESILNNDKMLTFARICVLFAFFSVRPRCMQKLCKNSGITYRLRG